MKSERRFFAILSLIAPLLYLAMYLPVWNGSELIMSSPLTVGLAVFQLFCAAAALLRLILRSKIGRFVAALFHTLSAISVILTCFFGFFFVLTLLGIPWFPSQN